MHPEVFRFPIGYGTCFDALKLPEARGTLPDLGVGAGCHIVRIGLQPRLIGLRRPALCGYGVVDTNPGLPAPGGKMAHGAEHERAEFGVSASCAVARACS